MDRCQWSNLENEEVRRKDHHRLRREPSLSQDDGSSQRLSQGSSQGLLLMKLHLRRWFGFGSSTTMVELNRHLGFFFFFLQREFSVALSEIFVAQRVLTH